MKSRRVSKKSSIYDVHLLKSAKKIKPTSYGKPTARSTSYLHLYLIDGNNKSTTLIYGFLPIDYRKVTNPQEPKSSNPRRESRLVRNYNNTMATPLYGTCVKCKRGMMVSVSDYRANRVLRPASDDLVHTVRPATRSNNTTHTRSRTIITHHCFRRVVDAAINSLNTDFPRNLNKNFFFTVFRLLRYAL